VIFKSMREVVIALHGLAGINECIDAKRAATKRDKRGELPYQ